MKALRVGVIGLGMGKAHIRGFREVEGVEVAALADMNEGLLASQGKEHGIAALYADAGEMLRKEQLDIVSVVTPNSTHKPLVLAALRAGCHVLCEKPMAMNAVEAGEMLAAANQAGRRIMINFSQRFTPLAWELHRQAAAGALGQVYAAQTQWLRRYGMPKFGGWFGQKAMSGGGPLIDLGVHRIDLALWFMGYPDPEWVMARTYNHLGSERARREQKAFDVEDYASAMITFKNGATLQASASWAGHIRERELMETRVLGSEAGLMFRNLEEGYQFEGEIYQQRDGVLYNTRPVAWSLPPLSAMRHFVESIRANTPHTATGQEGVTMMRILDAIYLSAAKGEPVRVA